MPNVTAVPSSSTLKGDTQIDEPGRVAGAIARRVAEIRATVPDLELAIDVDAGPALALARTGGHSLTAILVRAAATALRELPWANAAYRDGHFERYERVNVGIVVTTDAALVIPTVLDADRKSLPELTGELETLVARARSGELTSAEQAGSTFTLSDFTALAAHRITPIITAPQAAALTAGAIRREPVVADGDAIAPGDVMTLTLACDHRILFGERAARLLGRISELVREPAP